MPYIALNTSLKLTDDQKTTIKTAFGRHIELIPGKEELRLMIDISCGHDMYFAGEKRDLAYVKLCCYGSIEVEYKKIFTEAVFQTLMAETSLGIADIYLNCEDYHNWGTKGSLK